MNTNLANRAKPVPVLNGMQHLETADCAVRMANCVSIL
jgi:hypothetical protein